MQFLWQLKDLNTIPSSSNYHKDYYQLYFFLNKYNKSESPICPVYKQCVETNSHILQCPCYFQRRKRFFFKSGTFFGKSATSTAYSNQFLHYIQSFCHQTQHSEKYIDNGIFTYKNTIGWKNFFVDTYLLNFKHFTNNQENSNTNTGRTIFWLQSGHLSKNSGKYTMDINMVLMKISVTIQKINSFIGNLNRYINKRKSYVSLIKTNSATIPKNIHKIIILRPRWKLGSIWSSQLLTIANNNLKSLQPRTWRNFNIIFLTLSHHIDLHREKKYRQSKIQKSIDRHIFLWKILTNQLHIIELIGHKKICSHQE